MNDSKKTARDSIAPIRIGYVCVHLAIILATVALGCMAVTYSCEHNARYFLSTTTTTFLWATLCLSILLSFGVLFLFKKEPIEHLSSMIKSAYVARISNVFPAVLSVLVMLFALFEETLGKWSDLVLILGALSAVFFILKAFKKPTSSKAITGLAVFGLCAVIIASLYLDFKIELNSHFKLLVQFGAAGVICGVIADIRAALSSSFYESSKTVQRNYVRITVRGYLFLKLLSVALSLVCSVTVAIYFAEGNTALGMHYLLYSLFTLAYAVSSICEIIAAVISVIKSHI